MPFSKEYEPSENQLTHADEVSRWHKEKREAAPEDLSIEVPEERPQEVEIPETSTKAYSERCCFLFKNPKAAYLKEAKAIREYRNLLQHDYDAIFNLMKWIELPGNQHRRVKGHNYLAYQLWLYSFAVVGIEQDNKDNYIHNHYEDALIVVEETGMMLRHYMKPLEKITKEYKIIEQMSILIDTRMSLPAVETISLQAADVINNSILKGNKIHDYRRLHIYSRDLAKMHWTEFRALSFRDQLVQLTKGIDQFVEVIKSIRHLLDFPLARLKSANSSFGRRKYLLPHMKRMAKNLKAIITHEELTQSDEVIIKSLFTEISHHVLYIIQSGRSLVTKIWEIVLMTRLCYIYVHETPESHISLKPYEKVMSKKFKKDAKNLLTRSRYSSDDFFSVICPDILRKVPVVINNKLELALHYDGHRNTKDARSHHSSTSSYVKHSNSIPHHDNKGSSIAATVARNLRIDSRKINAHSNHSLPTERSLQSQHAMHDPATLH